MDERNGTMGVQLRARQLFFQFSPPSSRVPLYGSHLSSSSEKRRCPFYTACLRVRRTDDAVYTEIIYVCVYVCVYVYAEIIYVFGVQTILYTEIGALSQNFYGR